MDKRIILEYMDAKAMEEETEADLRDLRNTATVSDKVRGSNPEFPYNPQSFCVSGVDEHLIDYNREKILEEKLRTARRTRIAAEEIFNSAPLRIQRIIRLRVMQGLTWAEVSARMGGRTSENGVRMEFTRWLKEN